MQSNLKENQADLCGEKRAELISCMAGRLQWNTSANQPKVLLKSRASSKGKDGNHAKAKTPRLTPKGYGGGYAPCAR